MNDDGIQEDGVFATTTGSIQAQDMTFGPNGNLFVAMGTAGGVFEYDGWSGEPVGEFVPFDTELRVNGLGFDNFGRLLVSAIYPLSRVDAYDATTGEPMGPFLTDGFGGSDSIPTILSIKGSEGTVGINDANLDPEPTDTPQLLTGLSVYPNPFNPRTTISFSLEQPQNIELFIFDMAGTRIAVLANREFQAGTHSIDWQGKDLQGRAVSSGTYLVRIRTEERVTSQKIMLVR